MSRRGARNQALRNKNKPEIIDFCKDLGLEYRWLAGDWHMRIENVFDVFPTRKRWHFIPSDARGGFKDYDDLGRIFIEQVEGER